MSDNILSFSHSLSLLFLYSSPSPSPLLLSLPLSLPLPFSLSHLRVDAAEMLQQKQEDIAIDSRDGLRDFADGSYFGPFRCMSYK